MTIDTRERIIQECNTMLMSVGPSSMTMDDVARACGISKRTLYETFPDKRTLIGECVHRHHEAKNAAVKEIFDREAYTAVCREWEKNNQGKILY